MPRLVSLAMSASIAPLALAAQSQIPMRVGDCVKATTALEFFFKDEGEYERTHLINPDQHGVLLNIDSDWNEPSNVEFFDPVTREPIVNGAVFFHQFARVPWKQGNLKSTATITNEKCMTVKDGRDGYQPVVKMSACGTTDSQKWAQQFSFNAAECGARPIRSTENPGKCVDAVHPNKVLLTDCSGVDSQKFLFRCSGGDKCHILAMGGRKDMCLWWDDIADDTDLQLRPCNFNTAPADGPFTQVEVSAKPGGLVRQETRSNTAPPTV